MHVSRRIDEVANGILDKRTSTAHPKRLRMGLSHEVTR